MKRRLVLGSKAVADSFRRVFDERSEEVRSNYRGLVAAAQAARRDLVLLSNCYQGDRSDRHRWTADGYLRSLARLEEALSKAYRDCECKR